MEEQREVNLQNIFDRSLFVQEETPDNWTVGQHTYYRVLAVGTKDALDKKLTEFRELGVKVLDFDKRGGFWIFKTMSPLD